MVRKAASRLVIAALGTLSSAALADPIPFFHAPASIDAPVRAEAVLFSSKVVLREGRSLAALLIESGVGAGEAASAEAVAGANAGGPGGCRVQLSLSRNPDNGAVSVQRLVLASASRQIVIEQRGGRLKLVSSSSARARIA